MLRAVRSGPRAHRGPEGREIRSKEEGCTVPKFTWDIDPALFHLGSWELRYYSLIFVVVFLGGYQLLRWQVMRGGGEEKDAGDFFVYGVLAVLIGARLGHCIFYDYEKAMNDPLWVLQIWTGGLSSHGAVVGLIIAMWRYTKTKGVPFLEGADRFAFSATLGATLVRVGNFFNSEIVGRATDQSWGVKFPRYIEKHGDLIVFRHPTQLYEAALGCVVFAVLYFTDRALKERRPRGLLISLFFLVYFTGRLFVEHFKELQVRSLEEAAGFTMGQMLSAPCALLGLYGVITSLRKKEPVGWVSDLEEDDEEEDDEEEDDEEEDDEEEDDEEEDDEPAEEEKPAPRKAPSKAPAKKDSAHDSDVDEEFSRSKEERVKLTRESPSED
jgi:prolipoprotein diacylglyceryl transferase